jgi:AAA+ ATPase superfamily predicted ATPase
VLKRGKIRKREGKEEEKKRLIKKINLSPSSRSFIIGKKRVFLNSLTSN